jgi:UbiD family decarboxylase
MKGLIAFLEELETANELIRIKKPISTKFQIPAVVSKLDKREAVLFDSVRDSKFSVAANVLGTRNRISRAVGVPDGDLIKQINFAVSNASSLPKICSNFKLNRKSSNLFDLPIITHFEKDAGAYVTSSLVFAKDGETNTQNLSTHRLLRIDEKHMAVRMVEGRHLHKCYSVAKAHGEDLKISIVIGANPAIYVAAAYQATYGQDELTIANALLNGKLDVTKSRYSHLIIPSEIEILLEGRILSDKVEDEFMVEMLRTYDIARKQPVFELESIHFSDNSIYYDILPGYAEHRLLMGLPVEARILHSVRNVVSTTRTVNLTDGGSNWLHAVIQIRKKLEGEPKNAILAAFAAHPSLKMAIVVDEDINPTDPLQVEYAISTRCQADKDLLIVSNAKGSSLDPSSDQENLITSKLGIDATATLLKDPQRFEIARIPDQEEIDLKDVIENHNKWSFSKVEN